MCNFRLLFTQACATWLSMDQHAGAVAFYAMHFCQLLGLSSENSEQVIHAAYWHDIGKSGIAEFIWNKPTALSCEEVSLARNSHHDRR